MTLFAISENTEIKKIKPFSSKETLISPPVSVMLEKTVSIFVFM